MTSVIQGEKECYVCKTRNGLHNHHIFGAANRKKSDAFGYVVWLCGYHHNLSQDGVHQNRSLDLFFKELAQKHYEAVHGSRQEFIRTWGRSYF